MAGVCACIWGGGGESEGALGNPEELGRALGLVIEGGSGMGEAPQGSRKRGLG